MTHRPIVAVADDDAITRAALEEVLSDRFDVRTFESGQAVLDHLAGHTICLLLLDVQMPGLTGYETCRALRARPGLAEVPVIFLSAHAQPEERLLGYAAGGHDYVTKPYDIDELNAKITVAIELHRRTRQLAMDARSLSEAALATAEMMGEVGVVLDFQRAIGGCTEPEAIAHAAFDALRRFGLEGCMRLHGSEGAFTGATSGVVSALETTLLDHLESRPGMRIVTTGPNLGFAYGDVTLLVRSVAWALDATSPQTVDAMGRARDNLALVVEGALSRLKALEAEADARHLAVASRLIDATREALRDQEVTAQEIYRDLDAIFESVREDFEFLFPQLGLTPDQEQRLADIVAQQRIRGLGIVTRGRSAGQRLRLLLDHLERSAPSAAAP